MTDTNARPGLDELDALLAAATPGEWVQHSGDGEYVIGDVTDDGDSYVDVADTYAFRKGQQGYADAALIVALRNRAPAMLAAIRATYALVEDDEAAEQEALRLVEQQTDDDLRAYWEMFASIRRQSAARLRAALDEALGEAK